MTLGTYAAPLRRKQVDAIATEDILAVLRPIWGESQKRRLASGGGLSKSWTPHAQPAIGAPRIQPAGAAISTSCCRSARNLHAAITRLCPTPPFLPSLRAYASNRALAALALEFMILTAARSGEALGAKWSEIDVGEKLWTVPKVRMKGNREHRVPLSDRALAVLAEARKMQTNDFAFPGLRRGRPLSGMAMEMLLRRMKVESVTVHGFRSSFRDWIGDKTSFPREVAEAALAHAIGDETETAYRRSDALAKRRKLMDAWAAYCERKAGSNDVRLAR